MNQVPSFEEVTLLTKKEGMREMPPSCVELLPCLEEVFGYQPTEISTSLQAD